MSNFLTSCIGGSAGYTRSISILYRRLESAIQDRNRKKVSPIGLTRQNQSYSACKIKNIRPWNHGLIQFLWKVRMGRIFTKSIFIFHHVDMTSIFHPFNESHIFHMIPGSRVYNRRWDCSTQYRSAKNLRSNHTFISVRLVRSVFVLID